MATQRWKVAPEGGEPFTVVADSRDMLVWEKTNKAGRTAVDLVDGATLGDQYAIAYTASKRQGLFAGTRQEFDDACAIDAAEDEPEPDPTRPAP